MPDKILIHDNVGLGDLTFKNLSEGSALRFPDKEAVVDIISGKRITYKELHIESNRLGNALLDLGLKKGDHVTWISNDRYWVFYLFLGIPKCGMVKVSINYRSVPEEIVTQVEHSDAKAIILQEDFIDTISECRERMPDVEHYIVITEKMRKDQLPQGMHDMWDIMAKASDNDPGGRVGGTNPCDLAILQYTSGTTGIPKGVMHSHQTTISYWISFVPLGWHMGPQTRFVYPLPLFHWGGPAAVLGLLMIGGGTVVIPGKIDPIQLWELIEKEKSTVMSGLPVLWMAMKTFVPDWKEKYDLSSLAQIISSSAPMPPAVAEELSTTFPHLRIHDAYTSTEAVYTVTEHEMTVGYPGTVGVPFPMMQISIREIEDRQKECPRGKVGVIYGRGPTTHLGYYKNYEETKKCSLPGGWITSEDTGYLHEETGYLHLFDRVKDVINTGGETVSSWEVEDVVMRHHAVMECAIIGTPDNVYGEKVTAIVMLKPDAEATPEEIMDFCKGKIAGNKRPRRVEIVSEFPKTPMGKTKKKVLREKYWKGFDTRITG